MVSSVFSHWRGKLHVRERVAKRLWIVKKTDLPNLDEDPEVEGLIYDPSTVVTQVDKTKFWFVEMDPTIIRRLKKHQLEFSCEVILNHGDEESKCPRPTANTRQVRPAKTRKNHTGKASEIITRESAKYSHGAARKTLQSLNVANPLNSYILRPRSLDIAAG